MNKKTEQKDSLSLKAAEIARMTTLETAEITRRTALEVATIEGRASLQVAVITVKTNLRTAIIAGSVALLAAIITALAIIISAKIANHPQDKPPEPEQPIEIDQSVIAVVNDTNVNFRRDSVLEDDYIIRKFTLGETVQVLQRSDSTQSIEGVNAYWFEICTEDGAVGWVFGRYLMFSPSISNESVNAVIAVVNDTDVRFRKKPVLKDDYIIRKLTLGETVQVLQRSDSTQSIEGVNAYWFEICTEDGAVGWVFGRYLMFFP